ncbi:MAG TPA: YbjN domain-containing protein [Acidimicrobiales bacterium]|nr:YbjN domain-containing protein [Acidimicrobiales bacterium]
MIGRWAAARLAESEAVVAVDRQEDLGRWYLRLRGDEKDFVTVWLTVRQRTLHHETQVMPAPEVNVAETFEYLLRRNADLYQMRFALGFEDAVYLVGELPVADVTEDELDRIIGSSLAYVDASFPTAMAIGFAGRYRRRTG